MLPASELRAPGDSLSAPAGWWRWTCALFLLSIYLPDAERASFGLIWFRFRLITAGLVGLRVFVIILGLVFALAPVSVLLPTYGIDSWSIVPAFLNPLPDDPVLPVLFYTRALTFGSVGSPFKEGLDAAMLSSSSGYTDICEPFSSVPSRKKLGFDCCERCDLHSVPRCQSSPSVSCSKTS